jgi:hypothetical protein
MKPPCHPRSKRFAQASHWQGSREAAGKPTLSASQNELVYICALCELCEISSSVFLLMQT